MTALDRPAQRWLLVLGLILGTLLTGARDASASCVVPLEPIDLVTGRLAGDTVEERVHANLGQVLGVAELETVRVWDAEPDYTAASATVVSRYWGVRPPDDRFFNDERFAARIDGGHYVGSGAPEDTTSCEPSESQALGTREYVAVFEVSGFVPIESGVTAEDEAVFTEFLGAPVVVDPPTLPAEHPNLGTFSPGSSSVLWIVGGAGAAALVAGIAVWRARRTRNDAPA